MLPGYSILTLLALHEHFIVAPYELMEFIYATSASFAFIIGILLINGSITYGKAGPVSSIIQLQAIV